MTHYPPQHAGPKVCRKCHSPSVESRHQQILLRAGQQRRIIAWLRLLRQPTDRGVGDTASRLLAQASGRSVAPILARLMAACNCRPEDAAVTLNERYPYPPESIVSETSGYRDVPSDLHLLPRTRRERLLITVATGRVHERLLDRHTGQYLQAYAERIRADFIALTGVTQGWWGLEKMRIRPLIERYERALFVDADVIIRDGSPDIFGVVPRGHVGMHDDYPHCAAKNGLAWLEPARRAMLDSQMVDYYGYSGALNTGVVVTDREQSGIWSPWPDMDFPRSHVDEQLWVEWLAWRHPVFGLPTEFNTQWWFGDFFQRAKSAWFVHLANCPAERRAEMVRRLTRDGNVREVDRCHP